MVIQISQFLSNKQRCTRATMYTLCSQITRCCACVCSQKSEGLREREREKANVMTVDNTYMLACWTILTLCKPCMGILAFFSCIFSVNMNFFPCKSSIYWHLKLKWTKRRITMSKLYVLLLQKIIRFQRPVWVAHCYLWLQLLEICCPHRSTYTPT